MSEAHDEERFPYPFTATTAIARRLVPLLLFTLGTGLFVWAGREFYFWLRPWAVLPEATLGALCWATAAYFYTLLPEVRAGAAGIRVRRAVAGWRTYPWPAVACVRQTAQVDLLGWEESFYTLYVWRATRGRRGRVRRDWQRREARGFRFSGHIRNCERLLQVIQERSGGEATELLSHSNA